MCMYFYLCNKRIPTIIFFWENISGPTQLLKTLCLYIFWQKTIKNWVKIEKSGYFQKLLYIALQKFQDLRFLGLHIFSRPYGYLQPYDY